MTLTEITELNNRDLLELYAEIVKTDHYDPHKTPVAIEALYEAGITQYDIENIVLNRMEE